MRATGIVKKVDEVGRFVMPKSIRKTLGIIEGDSIEIYTEEDSIILKKYEKACCLCDNFEDLEKFKGKMICKNCMDELKEL